jgi:hypothetical protein
MTLINVDASVPSFMWAVVRLLLTLDGRSDMETAKRLLTPSSLPVKEEANDFKQAVKSLSDLGIVSADDTTVELSPEAKALSPADVTGFYGILRRSALDPTRNEGLTKRDDHSGPKDLTRALAWFLTQDPAVPMAWEAVAQVQKGGLAEHLKPPVTNDTRWGRFAYWAPTLGFAASPLIPMEGRSPLVPDCTIAVRETVLGSWEEGQSVNAAELVHRLIEELPVLPGGTYSRLLGLDAPEGKVSSSLSNALLSGEEDGWIKLSRPSDADNIFLTDGPGIRSVASFTINGRA